MGGKGSRGLVRTLALQLRMKDGRAVFGVVKNHGANLTPSTKRSLIFTVCHLPHDSQLVELKCLLFLQRDLMPN